MTSWNAVVATNLPHDDDTADEMLDRLEGFHPAAVGEVTMDVIITLESETLATATRTALALIPEAQAINVMTTEEFDLGVDRIPALISVRQAAERLGTTTQAVRERLGRGTLPGRRVDSVWVLPASI